MAHGNDDPNEDPDTPPEEDDRDLPDVSDMDDDEQPDILPCPHCRRPISEDADYCQHCRQNVSLHEPPASSRSLILLIMIAMLVVAGILGWLAAR